MQLDDAYANVPYIPSAESYPPRWTAEAATFRASLGARAAIDLAYGPSVRQRFDFFSAGPAPKGTVIFVHGGYWLRFDKSYWSHLAQGALGRGWNVSMVQYDLCPDVSIAQITDQIAASVAAIVARTSGPISLTGHSAGGHLVARMLAPEMLAAEVAQRIAAVAAISPVADLRPLLQTSMNADFGMDMAAAEAESPVLQPEPDTPVKIWVGDDERPVFLEQAAALAQAWGVEKVVVAGKHHFDIIDALLSSESDLTEFLTA
ncbi:MAG: alpha/beta hydrolase [Roseobacter sp.]|jgi:acetyl esterase/lipase|nr:alpha/beta hydrolase [Roseobacter sp.]